jgi:hypothetical protein
VTFAFGLLPDPSVGLVLGLVLETPWGFAVEGFGHIWGKDEAASLLGGCSFSLAYGGISMCPTVFERGRLLVEACGGLLLGEIQARGFGFDTSFEQANLHIAAWVQARLRVVVTGPLYATIGLAGSVLLHHPTFIYFDEGERTVLFRPWPVGLVFAIGLGVTFVP